MSKDMVADAPVGNWVDRYAPPGLRPYLRLSRADRPIGGWLLMWPCWWSAALVALNVGHSLPDFLHLTLFFIGAFVMRGAGCTLNDLADRNIDAAVERTRSRPIPAGQASVAGACAWLVAQCLIGFLVLIQFNNFTIWLGMSSLAIVMAYPFMKRITSWPQAVLGMAFSWGALMGWAAAAGSLGWPPVLLFAGAVLWVIAYDTIYACQDIEDDAIVGVGSTALLFGSRVRLAVAGFYSGCVFIFCIALALAGASLLSFLGLAGFALHLCWQVIRFDRLDRLRCLKVFRSNHGAGALFFAGMFLDCLRQASF